MTASSKTTKIDEKSLLYKLCDFLYKKRVERKGANTPVSILVSDFLTALKEFTKIPNRTNKKAWLVIAEELDDLLKYEKNKTGGPLIRLEGKKIDIKKVRENTNLSFIYNREDIEKYVKDLETGDSKNKKKQKGTQSINLIEILEDQTENKKITIYINKERDCPLYYSRGIYWGKMYELAKNKQTDYKKGFFDYFNSNYMNPLYTQTSFFVGKIFRKEGEIIVPNVKIEIITQKKISQQLKSA